MRKIGDRILLGIAAGIICGMPGRVVNDIEYHLRLTDVKYGQMASNLFLPKRKSDTKEARVIGSIVNHTMISLTGILVTYLLSATGRDKAVVKGMGVTSLLWMALFGLGPRLQLTVNSKKPLSSILSFIDHAVFGGLCGFFVSKVGADTLFPDHQVRGKDGKLPLIYSMAKEK
ncbi:hypothetical protein [Candidatus Formimonas warabiya]|uniref:DUF1440 domain-containing protein n=1 Tax=Formimonas warabiya TaxID=1761012 RepID=A0A3G1KRH5_FORW1|nr:hypothetical protein [Candidatus Formimonas warabiya]ATW25047.1 hypothetical protein DCMF_09900 [Candidatus Formimonas warabiya]